MYPWSDLFEMIPVLVIFPVIYYIVKATLEHSTRKKLIEKGIVNEDIRHLYANTETVSLPSSLKWGIVLVLVGITTVILKAVGDVSAEVAIGVILIAAGAGLIFFYALATSKANKEKKGLDQKNI